MITLASTVLFISLVASFALRTWGVPRRVLVRDRWGLVSSLVTALTGSAISSLFVNWVTVPVAVWLAGVGLLSAGSVGAALRWPQVPWFAGTRPAIRAAVAVPYWSICALLIGVAFV